MQALYISAVRPEQARHFLPTLRSMLLHNFPQHIVFFLCPLASCWPCAFLLRSRASQQRIDRFCRIRRKTFTSLELKVLLLLITLISPMKEVQRKAIHWAIFLRLLSSQQVPPYQQRRTVSPKETHLMHLKKKEINKKTINEALNSLPRSILPSTSMYQ